MSPNRMPAALSVLTVFTLAWRVMGTGGVLWADPAGGVIANQLVDALVGVVFVAVALYVWRMTRSGLAATLWLMALCIMIFTGRSPDLPQGHLSTVDFMIRLAATLVGTSAFLDFVAACVRPADKSLGGRLRLAIYSPAIVGLATIVPVLFLSTEKHAWLAPIPDGIISLVYGQGFLFQILGLILVARGRRRFPDLDPLFWIMAITIAGYFGVTIATKVAASFEYPAGLGTHPYAWLQVALAVVMGWTVLQRRHARRLES